MDAATNAEKIDEAKIHRGGGGGSGSRTVLPTRRLNETWRRVPPPNLSAIICPPLPILFCTQIVTITIIFGNWVEILKVKKTLTRKAKVIFRRRHRDEMKIQCFDRERSRAGVDGEEDINETKSTHSWNASLKLEKKIWQLCVCA